MLLGGLTPDLIDALAVIADSMPAHKEAVHQRLLGEIMFVLSGVAYGPKPLRGPAVSGTSASGIGGSRTPDQKHEGEGTLAKVWRFFTSDFDSLEGLLLGQEPGPETQRQPGECEGRDFSGSSRGGSGKDSSRGSREQGVRIKRRGFGPWVDPETAFVEDLPRMNILPHTHGYFCPQDRIVGHRHGVGNGLVESAEGSRGQRQGGLSTSGRIHLDCRGSSHCRVTKYDDRDSDRDLLSQLNYNPSLVLLALKTLQLLSTPSSGVLLLVHRHILPFLSAVEESVREQAASTAAALIGPIAKNRLTRLKGPSAEALNAVLTRLLEVCVTDTSSSVRRKVLISVQESFDRHLLHEQRVASLLFLATDECFDIRIAAIALLGSLAALNPAVVLPNMRGVLMNAIQQLQHGSLDRHREDAALTICAYLRAQALHRVVKPFTGTLIGSLPIDAGSGARLTMAGMETLGELCVVMGASMLEHVTSLLPLIILNILDGSSQRKQVRLHNV